jgi:hypothetical protein
LPTRGAAAPRQEADMFRLTVVDHLRLSFGHVVRNYTLHARKADRLARLAWTTKLIVLALLGVATATTIANLLGAGRPQQIAAVVATALAFAGHAVYVAIGLEPRLLAHRSCANQLWLVSERYRALLAEIQDGLVDSAGLLRRRDELIQQVHAIYEHAPPADRRSYESARDAAQKSGEASLTDEEIDHFLPESLRKGSAAKPAEAAAEGAGHA